MMSEQLHHIRGLLGENAVLLPIPTGKKAPCIKAWQNLTIEDCESPEYQKKLLESGNLGVLLGSASGGLCSIDVDHDDEVDTFLDMNPVLRSTLRTRGNRGENIWVHMEGEYPRLTKIIVEGKAWGEWRSDGGQTVIAGVHPTGNPYEFINEAEPLRVQFETIKWPKGISSAFRGNRIGRRHLSASSEHLRESVSSTGPANSLSSARSANSTSLHDTPLIVRDSKSLVIQSIEARKAFLIKHLKLVPRYEEWVERVHSPQQGTRNKSLIEMVTFLCHCVAPETVLLFSEQFYSWNAPVWIDSKALHMKEAKHHLKAVLAHYPDELPEDERKVYEVLDKRDQATFRICRDLASLKKEKNGDSSFFLSCGELGMRIRCDSAQAHRILKRFINYKILEIKEKGLQRKSGRKAKATSFLWLYSLRKPEREQNETKL